MHKEALDIAANLMVQFQHENNGFAMSVELEVPGDGITGVFGPSGSGKTTLLRAISGLLHLESAQIRMGEKSWQSDVNSVPTHQRGIGYVFQEASLFPHLSVEENLAYGQRRTNHGLGRERANHLLELLGIEGLLKRDSKSLSGGEQQRVALARALMTNPQLLLMDEPLAALDFARKKEILPYLKNLKTELSIPILYVSHSADEIAELADWLVVLDAGVVTASGPIHETFPSISAAAHGESDLAVLIEATVKSLESQWGLLKVELDGGELLVKDNGAQPGDQIRMRIQARDVSINRVEANQSSIVNSLMARINDIQEGPDRASALVSTTLKNSSVQIKANVTRLSVDKLALARGDEIFLQLKSVAILS